MPSLSDDPLLTPNATGEELGVSPQGTLAKWRLRGCGPRYCKIGRLVRYRRSDVEAWITAQARNSTSDPA